MPDLTADEVCALLQAGARHYGTNEIAAAVHLITYTELPSWVRLQRALRVKTVEDRDGQPVQAAFLDWTIFDEGGSFDTRRLGGGDSRLLALASALVLGRDVNVCEVLDGLGHAHAKRVTEAILIVTGYRDWYTVEATARERRCLT